MNSIKNLAARARIANPIFALGLILMSLGAGTAIAAAILSSLPLFLTGLAILSAGFFGAGDGSDK